MVQRLPKLHGGSPIPRCHQSHRQHLLHSASRPSTGLVNTLPTPSSGRRGPGDGAVRGSCPTRVPACAWSAYLQCLCRQPDPTGQPASQKVTPAYLLLLLLALHKRRRGLPCRFGAGRPRAAVLHHVLYLAGDGAPVPWGVVHPRHEPHAARGRHAHKGSTASTALVCLTALVVRRQGDAMGLRRMARGIGTLSRLTGQMGR
jgi:hypothetical protein